MDFDFTHEQQLFNESAQRFMREQHAYQRHLQRQAEPEASRMAIWKKFAALGWLGLPFSEADGGLGCGVIETMLLMQSFGRSLVTAPYLTSIVIGGEILRRGDTSIYRRSRITELINGETTLAVAHAEMAARYDLAMTETKAERTSSGWVINGKKCVVLNGQQAPQLIVSARTSGPVQARQGITLFLVPADAVGITRSAYPLLDGSDGADIRFDQVTVNSSAVIGEIDKGLPILEAAIDLGLAAISAEAVGIMDALIEQTIAHCQTRVQFGQPIGQFQVLQHRLVDMFMEAEQTRSLLYLATIRLLEADESAVATANIQSGNFQSADIQSALAALKVQVGKAGRLIGQEAIQMHGGMGMSNEVMVGHYFKRLTMIDALFGNVDFHLKKFGAIQTSKSY